MNKNLNASQIKQHYKSLLKNTYPLVFAGQHKTTQSRLDVFDKLDYQVEKLHLHLFLKRNNPISHLYLLNQIDFRKYLMFL